MWNLSAKAKTLNPKLTALRYIRLEARQTQRPKADQQIRLQGKLGLWGLGLRDFRAFGSRDLKLRQSAELCRVAGTDCPKELAVDMLVVPKYLRPLLPRTVGLCNP